MRLQNDLYCVEWDVKLLYHTMDLSPTVSKVNDDFSRKLQNFLTPGILPPAEKQGAKYLGIWYRRKGSKT